MNGRELLTRWRRWRASGTVDLMPGGCTFSRGQTVLIDGEPYRVLDSLGFRLWIRPATLYGAQRDLNDALGDFGRAYADALGIPTLAAWIDRTLRRLRPPSRLS